MGPLMVSLALGTTATRAVRRRGMLASLKLYTYGGAFETKLCGGVHPPAQQRSRVEPTATLCLPERGENDNGETVVGQDEVGLQ